MKRITAALSAAVCFVAIGVHASDRTGVYALVDKVVFEPGGDKPERVQVWGAFAVASRHDNTAYDEVRRGYLYFTAAGPAELARREWNDLKVLAGTRRIAAFGSRFGQSLRVRAADEAPHAPDDYPMDVGIRLIPSDREYAPIKALAAEIRR